MRVQRTYPQPDSPAPSIGPRERAMAVFKYLLDLEPEAATKHPLFACIVHSYEQSFKQGREAETDYPERYEPSLVPLLTGSRDVPVEVRKFGDIPPKQPEKL